MLIFDEVRAASFPVDSISNNAVKSEEAMLILENNARMALMKSLSDRIDSGTSEEIVKKENSGRSHLAFCKDGSKSTCEVFLVRQFEDNFEDYLVTFNSVYGSSFDVSDFEFKIESLGLLGGYYGFKLFGSSDKEIEIYDDISKVSVKPKFEVEIFVTS